MKTTTVATLKSHLSALLKRVERGETILVLNRGTPVARIVPVRRSANVADEERLERLEKAGVIRRGPAKPDWSFLDEPAPEMTHGYSLLRALLEEREEGR